MPATLRPEAFCPAPLSCLSPSRSPPLPRPHLSLQVRAEADSLRRDLTQQTQRLSELTAQLEQERGQSEWAVGVLGVLGVLHLGGQVEACDEQKACSAGVCVWERARGYSAGVWARLDC